MKTFYSDLLTRLGLSLAEAAELHGVGLSTVKHWASGRRGPSCGWDGLINELRDYEAEIIDRSEQFREIHEAQGFPALDINASEADPITRMAMVDFILTSDVAVHEGETDATRMARQARRPN